MRNFVPIRWLSLCPSTDAQQAELESLHLLRSMGEVWKRWPWCKSSLRLDACEISICSFLRDERKSQFCSLSLFSSEQRTWYQLSTQYLLSLSIYICISEIDLSFSSVRTSMNTLLSSIFLSLSFAPFSFCICMCCVDNTSTHTYAQLNC